MDPFTQTLLVAGGIFIVSFVLGRQSGMATQDKIIEATINHLIEDGYIAAGKNADGEDILIPIAELERR